MVQAETRAVYPTVLCAGVLTADLFVPPLPRLPAPGELLATEDFLIDSGGCAANTATCLARLGVTAAIAGMVGSDNFGDFVIQNLHGKGVDTRGIRRSSTHGTSKTIILPVVGADRRYIHTVGANADLTAEDIGSDLLTPAQVFYVGGYLVLPSLTQPDLSRLLQAARGRGIRTVLDVIVPAGASTPSITDLAEILPYVDVFTPNNAEAEILTGTSDPREQAAAFLAAGCGTAIITRGAAGALLMTAEVTLEAAAVSVEVTDPSGAGDAFAAGCIVGLLERWDLQRMLSFASVVGASACTHLGTTAGVFSRGQAEAYLQEHRVHIRTEVTEPRQSPGIQEARG